MRAQGLIQDQLIDKSGVSKWKNTGYTICNNLCLLGRSKNENCTIGVLIKESAEPHLNNDEQ